VAIPEHTRSKARSVPRDGLPPTIVRGVWQIMTNTLVNEAVSEHRSAHGESNAKFSERSLSATFVCKPSRAKSTEFP
jgi:hypothetical protein